MMSNETIAFINDIPNTRVKAEYEEAFVHMTVAENWDRKKIDRLSFNHSDLLPYLREEHKRYDEIDAAIFNTSLKLVKNLNGHLKHMMKTRGWYTKKVREIQNSKDPRPRKIDKPDLVLKSPTRISTRE